MPESQPIRRTSLPSWLISLLLHLALILVLGLTLRLGPPQGAAAERTAEVGIVLKRQDAEGQSFQGENDAAADSNALAPSNAESLESLLDEPQPSDPSEVLPSLAVIGPRALDGGGVPTAAGAADGPGGNRALGGKATTGVFGVQGTGYKFVYVFDRSGSMSGSGGAGGSDRSALGAAKAQLIASLGSLERTHQFQIIFYNERPQRFEPPGQPNRLFFATEQNKALAAKFIGSIMAEGPTNHMDALLMAIKWQPDVIFFLTDADKPDLSPRELAEIRRRAAGITINAVEFGLGPQMERDNFLVKLARESGGQHGYVDISGLRRRR